MQLVRPMQLPFIKMQAQGNDFVILNSLENDLPELNDEFVRAITERRYGVGCDQLLVLSASKQADAHMQIFNNDGTEAGNCGNGLRCAASLLLHSLNQNSVSIALHDRVITAEKTEHGIAVNMGRATVLKRSDAQIDVEIGNQHSVFFEAVNSFPADRNVEIITGQVADHAYIDIIERGAGRTLACGSGACATTAAIWESEGHQRPQTIEMPGGQVFVSGSLDQMILAGSVKTVFTGEYLFQPAAA